MPSLPHDLTEVQRRRSVDPHSWGPAATAKLRCSTVRLPPSDAKKTPPPCGHGEAARMQSEPGRLWVRRLSSQAANPLQPRTRLPGTCPGEQPASRSGQKYGPPVARVEAVLFRRCGRSRVSRRGLLQPRIDPQSGCSRPCSQQPRACGRARRRGIDRGHAGLPPQVPIAVWSKHRFKEHYPFPQRRGKGSAYTP